MLESYLQALMEVSLVFGIVMVYFSLGMLIGWIVWSDNLDKNKVARR